MSQYHRSPSHSRIAVWFLFVLVVFLSSPIDGFQSKPQQAWKPLGGLMPDHPWTSDTACFAESKKEGASVRFSGTDATLTNPLDAFLSFMASDVTSIVLGLVGLFLVVGHRVAGLDNIDNTENLTVQTRTDLLATFACGSVLLNGITKLDVTTALAEAVILEGQALPSAELLMGDDESQSTLLWGLDSLLVATPAKTAVVLEKQSAEGDWKMVARAGIVSSTVTIPETTPILKRVATPGNTKETYLPTLQALPGKTEFPYLPSNTQLAVLIPYSKDNRRALVLGGNMAKSFSPRDVAWARIVAERMGSS